MQKAWAFFCANARRLFIYYDRYKIVLIKDMFEGIDIPLLKNEYRYYNLSGKAVYIENFIKINTFSQEEIILKLKKGMIKVVGEGLWVRELNTSCILIEGKIKGVEVY